VPAEGENPPDVIVSVTPPPLPHQPARLAAHGGHEVFPWGRAFPAGVDRLQN
jgi:hypothetical protein